MAAQLTSESIRPKAATQSLAIFLGEAGSAKSAILNEALEPNSETKALPSDSTIPVINTLPPSRTTMRAIAAPIPDVPPVTITTLSFNFMQV
jgi:hypothetical protein